MHLNLPVHCTVVATTHLSSTRHCNQTKQCNGRELQCTEVEDLGVFVDKDLKFEQHINETIKKKANIFYSRHDHTLQSI